MLGIFTSKITVGMFLLFMITFVFLASDWIYGPYASVVRNVMISYFIVFLLVKAFTGMPIPLVGASLPEISTFAIGFILTAVILLTLPIGGAAVGEITADKVRLAFGFGILHGFIKAYIEEAIFRGMLMKKVGIVFSNIMFGLFHVGVIIMTLTAAGLAVTTSSVGIPVLILIMLGFVWSWMAIRWGLMSAVGSHLAYNLFAFGVLSSVFGGG